MGGFFGITSKQDCMVDVFFGVDYHSHLGTRRGGMAAYDEKIGLQRDILEHLEDLVGIHLGIHRSQGGNRIGQ